MNLFLRGMGKLTRNKDMISIRGIPSVKNKSMHKFFKIALRNPCLRGMLMNMGSLDESGYIKALMVHVYS